jgi:MOSC domain-containing protein
MTSEATTHPGRIAAIWRYPVKSMMGEELAMAAVTERGLFGDRAFALVDSESGKVISAKNPRKWGDMFAFRAVFSETTDQAGPLPPARITFPDGSSANTAEPDVDDRLSQRLSRPVRLAASAPQTASIEGYWPDYHWLQQPDEIFNVELPVGTFFDCAPIHLVTTATLHWLAALAPNSRFEVRRFRPNFVIDCADSVEGFVENEWIGHTVSIGSEVRLLVVRPTARCVMTTLPQGDLPKDPDVLRTIVQKNKGNVGVYATLVRGGTVRRGDAVALA